ncbi:DUF2971 domain-containing protein [Halococcus sp. IIIV-5B]|nr:DUF2971 domain-containing protein [Halococcus sp. IIIV-5B]
MSAELDQFDDPVVDASPDLADETLIRHYVSVSQFLSIVEGEHLWLSSVGGFTDSLEGAATDMGKDAFDDMDELIDEAKQREMADETTEALLDEASAENVFNLRKTIRNHCLVNCWRLGEDAESYKESAVFWNSYVPGGIGVAIESRVGKLKDLFEQHIETEHASLTPSVGPIGMVGEVSYIDFESAYDLAGHPARLLCKHDGFAEEREYRLIVNSIGPDERAKAMVGANVDAPFGEYMYVDPAQLIDKVYVAPNAPQHLMESIKSILGDRSGFDSDSVQWSELYRDDPTY